MAFQNATDNRLLSRGPAYLLSVHLTPTGGAQGAVLIYDGVNNLAPLRCTVRTPSSVSYDTAFAEPLYFEHGIYIEVSAATEALCIYEPVSDEEPPSPPSVTSPA